MSAKNTALFGAGLALAIGAVSVDHKTAPAPKPVTANLINENPCAAAMVQKKGGRNYDDIASSASSSAPRAAPKPATAPAPAVNPCSVGQ